MGPPSCMWSVADRSIVTQNMTVQFIDPCHNAWLVSAPISPFATQDLIKVSVLLSVQVLSFFRHFTLLTNKCPP